MRYSELMSPLSQFTLLLDLQSARNCVLILTESSLWIIPVQEASSSCCHIFSLDVIFIHFPRLSLELLWFKQLQLNCCSAILIQWSMMKSWVYLNSDDVNSPLLVVAVVQTDGRLVYLTVVWSAHPLLIHFLLAAEIPWQKILWAAWKKKSKAF